MPRVLFLTPTAARRVRAEIARARGNEVCFLARVGEGGEVVDPKVVARGNPEAVPAAARDAEPGMLLLHNHPSGVLDPSDADLAVAARLYEDGLGFAITDNEARELYVVVEPPRTRETVPLDEAEIEAALAPGGPISRAHPRYEDRPAQRELAALVARAYNGGTVALAEAGTGTGKSVAYLLPAVRWAVANQERTVVSTNTINLQEQLVGKDLPLVRRALGEPFRFALVKGRRNYISIRRALRAGEASGSLFDGGRVAELDAILEWMRQTREGSVQDLAFTPSAEVWDEVASESDVCLRARCPHFDECFYQRARRQAAAADVLVVNHHLLFSDLAVRRAQGNYTGPAVLPSYRRVVLDEAHNLEDSATSHLGASVSRRGLFRLLSRLDRRGKGVLAALEERLKRGPEDPAQQAALRRIGSELRPALDRARERAAAFFGELALILAAAKEDVLRLPAGFAAEPAWTEGPEPALADLLPLLDEVARRLEALRRELAGDPDWAEPLEERLLELEAAAGRTRAAADSLRVVFQPGSEPFPLVRWLERRGSGGGETQVGGQAAPIDLSDALRDALFDRVDTAVLTSATLTTRDGFEFLRRRLGLSAGGLRIEEAVYPSPFDFESQTLVAVPTDMPVPREGTDPRFDDAIAAAAVDLAGVSDGGIFVLFTSYRSLRAVAALLRERGAGDRWPLFVQGEAPRARLLERFTGSGRGVLLGVASFWEGVDVPGEPLRGLVLTRLPFKPPAEPLTAARVEAIQAEGGNAFYEYVLPHAALRLKQGFGRLLRTRTDRGAVVLLDRRVLERSYGRYFLDSLPPAPVHRGPWSELREGLGRFYAGAPDAVAVPAR